MQQPNASKSAHSSKNAMFWRPDAQIDEARKHPGWMKFHRQCGQAGLYFDDIEKNGRGYTCVTCRLEKRSGTYLMYLVANGSGRTVLEAVLSGFDASVAAGWPIDVAVRGLLTARPAPTVAVISDDDLLGGPAVASAVVIDDSELV